MIKYTVSEFRLKAVVWQWKQSDLFITSFFLQLHSLYVSYRGKELPMSFFRIQSIFMSNSNKVSIAV